MFGVFNRSVGARLMALIVVMAMGLTGISVFSINEIHKNGQENEATLKKSTVPPMARMPRARPSSTSKPRCRSGNVLIRGGDPQAFERHWKAFEERGHRA